MTKMKNTKKGMAKKALSISLIAAMLATSNVPVWAAFEAEDPSEVIVETVESPVDPTVEMAADSFNAEAQAVDEAAPAELPVVEEFPVTYSTDETINTNNYVEDNLKVEAGAWDSKITATGTIKDTDGDPVYGMTYIWLADGVQAAGYGATGNTTGDLSLIEYTPQIQDYGKSLALQITKKEGSTTVYNKIIQAGTVKAKDISDSLTTALVFDPVEYNGKVQYAAPRNAYNVNAGGNTITAADITWHYDQKDGDFTNATAVDSSGNAIENDKISVYGTVEGVYGFTGTTATGKYAITQKTITASDLEVTMKNASFEYTGSLIDLNKDDITVTAVSNDGNTKTDITAALKAGTGIVTGSDSGAIGNNYKATIDAENAFDTTDEAKALYANYKLPTSSVPVASKDSYKITARNLSDCTAVIIKDYELDAFKKDKTVTASDIKITGKDGKSFNANVSGLNITINKAAIDAADADRTGRIENAVTVSASGANFSGSVNAALVLTTSSLSGATVTTTKNGTTSTLDSTKPAVGKAALQVPYTGKAYDLKKDYGLQVKIGDVALKTGEYTIEYDNNINAGIVTATIKGAGSYAGSDKTVYFEITKAAIADGDVEKTTDTSLSINPSNNSDASLYKDEFKLAIKKDIDGDGTKETLTEGTDYTVKYFYGAKANSTTEDGSNVAGNYVIAKITLAKNGNFSGTLSNVALVIGKKSIKDVQIKVTPETYTYTGKSITPDLVVTDGSNELEKDVDYKLTVKNATNIGTATVTITALSTSTDYQAGTTASATFKIEAAKAEDVKVELALTSSGNAATKFLYTGKQIRPVVQDVKLNGVSVKDDFSITYPVYGDNKDAGKEMGSVTISPKTSNFTGTKTQTFDIQGESLTGTLKVYDTDNRLFKTDYDEEIGYHTLLNKNNAYYSERYNGKEHTFKTTFNASDISKKLVEGTDYEVQYLENVEVGIGYFFVVAKGNYEGATTETFDTSTGKVTVKNIVPNTLHRFFITGSEIYAEDVTVENGVYAGGLLVNPKVTVVVSGVELTEGVDYKIKTYPINPNDYTVGVDATTGKPYYAEIIPMGGYGYSDEEGYGSLEFKWGIDKFDLKDADISVKNNTVTVKNGNIPVSDNDYTVKNNEDGTITVTAKEDSKNYTGSKTVDANIVEVPEITAVSDPSADRNTINVTVNKTVENASAYDYVLCNSEEDLAAMNFFKANKGVEGTTSQFQFVRSGSYKVYVRAIARDAEGRKSYSDWSKAADITISTDTPNATTINKVSVSGNKVTVTFTPGARTEGVDVMLGQTLRSSNGEPQRPVTSNFTKYLQKNVNSAAGKRQTVTFTGVAKGTHYIGVHPYITSNDGLKYFGRWSKQTTATSVVIK